ncbi:hypothetical protein CNMCM8980_005720 [Aspergillus fumigatiaffinis]|uniref:Uncharacterized protein n=1 Tax=Aspergillus fumigatiaffinis TaxID=340414 RepID=A0A8H4HGE2_9EURO|nr:hypothetical protein CNMCM5878_005929 [Aspergillus fumigatiaffinis]KAF4234059.1 hypothetical protein CNMCM6457_004208 [Aspergillus fumigatiaffinis]KAF4243852.1 hypothetical protein CNMCM6805_010363 [Aspergillus fumigatiaffinis]KAF4248562.1 hypothetical protein CNMCM8980_005720 [Aspergillus fumigatiaffinis]
MDPLDQLTDFEFLLEQVRQVKSDRNVSIPDQAQHFHKTLVGQIESFSEIEKKHLYRYLKLSRNNEELQASYDELNESLSQELRKVERQNAELQDAKAALREAQKDCEAKEEYIRDAEAANAALKEKNNEQRSLIKSYKQDWKSMKEELEIRDKTIDDLQTSLRSKGALVEKYEREIQQYRKQRKEWERQVDEAAQYLDDKSEVLKWLNEVSESVVGSTTDDGADDETQCTTDSEKEDKATSATGRRLDLRESAMDCSYEAISVDEPKSICGATLDEEMMYLSDSLSALSIERGPSPLECYMTDCHEISSPASSYDLDFVPRRRKRQKQRAKEVEDTELAHKRTKFRKHCESPVQSDSGESASFDDQDRKQGPAECCASPVQSDSEADTSFDFGASNQGPTETRFPIDCMKTGQAIFSISRGVQTVACRMDGPVIIPSIESPEASGRSRPLLLTGRRGRYKDPVYLPKLYAKSQRLTHQDRELGGSRPRYVSMTRLVLRSRVASWPLNQAEQESAEQDDLQQENIETLLVSPSSNNGSESLEAEADAGPVLKTVSHKPPPRPGYRSQSDGKVTDTMKKQGISASSRTSMGRKWWLPFMTVLVVLLSILSILSPDEEHRSWNRVNMMPHDPLTKLRKCQDSRCKVALAAEWEIVRRTDSDFLSVG